MLGTQWHRACDQPGYTGVLLHDTRRSGVHAVVRSVALDSICMKISTRATGSVFERYDTASDQDLTDTRDRGAQFGHNQAAKVVN